MRVTEVRKAGSSDPRRPKASANTYAAGSAADFLRYTLFFREYNFGVLVTCRRDFYFAFSHIPLYTISGGTNAAACVSGFNTYLTGALHDKKRIGSRFRF